MSKWVRDSGVVKHVMLRKLICISIWKLTSISKGVKEKSKKQIQIKILKKFLIKVWKSVIVTAVSLNKYWVIFIECKSLAITRRITKNDFTRKFQIYIHNHQKKALCSTPTSTDKQKLKKTWKATDCMWKKHDSEVTLCVPITFNT